MLYTLKHIYIFYVFMVTFCKASFNSLNSLIPVMETQTLWFIFKVNTFFFINV
jgi:hypothetical protein